MVPVRASLASHLHSLSFTFQGFTLFLMSEVTLFFFFFFITLKPRVE